MITKNAKVKNRKTERFCRAAAVLLLSACASQQRIPAPGTRPAPAPASRSASSTMTATAEDTVIFERTMRRAAAERLDTLPIGEIVVRVGQWFVGAPYMPGTLEQPGAEHLVINLREFDCVTFVENTLSLARVIRAGTTDFASFAQQLAQLRYRAGKLAGYPSRLHYFSEWIADNESKGLVRNETAELGVVDPEPIDFMTTHAAAYRQLADPGVAAAIAQMEKRLSSVPRYMIPESSIEGLEDRIHSGDVIAATSTLAGMDVAHTGIAVRVNGRLHLMHAPLVGTKVEISAVPLADRITANEKQDGIMVARPR